MEGIELASFQIIAAVGTARSLYIEAIDLARDGKFDEAREKIEEGQQVFVEGHQAHMGLITEEAQGNATDVKLILLHAEDQLMSAEAFGILASKFIDVYESMSK